MIRRLLVPLFALALAAPALAAQDTAPRPPRPPRPPKSSSTLITEADIEKVRATVATAYDVVQLLRPRWFRSREPLYLPGDGSSMRFQELHVYMDDHEMGGVEFLKSVPAGQVYTLRFMSMAEIGARFGPSSGPGIVVTLRR